MFGHSYGGYATYFCLVKYAELFNAGISIAAPTDIKAWMKKQKDDDNYYSYEFWNTALGSNESSYLKKISPISYANDINSPLLIMHGGNDKTVPVDQAENMIEKIKKHNKNLEFRIWNSADHSFTDIDDFKEMLEESNQFFKNHTK